MPKRNHLRKVLHLFFYAVFYTTCLLGQRMYLDIPPTMSDSDNFGLMSVRTSHDEEFQFSLSANDFKLGLVHLIRTLLSFCIDNNLYNHHPNCPEELYTQYLLQHLNAEVVFSEDLRQQIKRELYDLTWYQTEMSPEFLSEMKKKHKKSIDRLLQSIGDIFSFHQVVVIDTQMLWEKATASFKTAGEHKFDIDLCLHHFYHVIFYQDTANLFKLKNSNQTYGVIEEHSEYSGRAECRGNVLAGDMSLFANGYWKRYDLDHYGRLLPADAPVVQKDESGFYLLVHDFWFCENVGHAIWASTLFWTLLASPLKEKLRGIHITAHESIRCANEPVKRFSILSFQAMVFAASKAGINVLVRDKGWTYYYMSFFFKPPLFNRCDFENKSIGSQIRSECEPIVATLENIMDRSPNAIYPHLVDKLQNWHHSRDGNRLMTSTFLELCEIDDRNKNTDLPTEFHALIISRNHSRHIVNIDEVTAYLESYFTGITGSHPRSAQRWRVSAINMGDLPVCEQISLIRKTRVLVAVHGAESIFATFLQPGSVIIDIHPGCCMQEEFSYTNAQMYKAAGLVHTYFQGAFASSSICGRKWHALHMSYYCGTLIDIAMLSDVFNSLASFLVNTRWPMATPV